MISVRNHRFNKSDLMLTSSSFFKVLWKIMIDEVIKSIIMSQKLWMIAVTNAMLNDESE